MAKKKGSKRAKKKAPAKKKTARATPKRAASKTKRPRAPKRAAAKKRSAGPKKGGPKKRQNRAILSPKWYEKILASPPGQYATRHHPKDLAHGNAAYWRLPAHKRAAHALALFRKGGRSRRKAVAIARAEQRHAEGPPQLRRNPGGFSEAEARRQYTRKHWGLRGQGAVREGRAPDPRQGTLVKLGELREVTYRTSKRGDGLSDYVHEFEGRRPTLAFGPGGLVVVGGSYRVRDGGIDG